MNLNLFLPGFLFVFILCGSCATKSKPEIVDSLTIVDSYISSDKQKARELLNEIDKSSLFPDDLDYYNLLDIIITDQLFIPFKDDSLISPLTKRGHFSRDIYNKFRANLYHGIVLYRINPYDSIGYKYFRKAEELSNNSKVPNNKYKLLNYYYLARYNKRWKNTDRAIEYYNISFSLTNKSSPNYYYAILIELFWSYYAKNDLESMSDIVSYITEDDNIPVRTRNSTYNLLSAYYHLHSDFQDAIKFASLDLSNRDIEGIKKTLIILADSYYHLSQIDSAIHYTNLCLKYNLNNDSYENIILQYHYNEMLGKLYGEKGDLRSSLKHYSNATELHHTLLEYASENMVAEIEKKYEAEKKDNTILRLHLLLILFIAIIIITILISYVITLRHKTNAVKHKEEAQLSQAKNKEAEMIKSIIEAQTGQIPFILDTIYRTIVIEKQFDKRIDSYNLFVGNLKRDKRNRLNGILEDRKTIDFFPILKVISNMSVTDRTIILFRKLGYSIKYISKVLDTTESSIRATRARLRGSIKNHPGISQSDKEYLSTILE